MKAAYSTETSPEKAVAAINAELSPMAPRMVLFFASSAYDPDALGQGMREAFGDIPTLGCTTAGEIVSGRMLKGSVVAMGFSENTLEGGSVQLLRDLRGKAEVDAGLDDLAAHFDGPMSRLDPTAHIGIILIDGISGAEEVVMERIGDQTDVPFIGGSAGDDLRFKAAHVFANGTVARGAAVLALIKPKVPFDIIKTQSFTETGRTLTATDVDEGRREVIRFNGRSAAEAYAEAVGVPVAEASERFMHNPLGLMAGGEPYVRSPQRIVEDRVRFYCTVKAGMTLSLLESTDIVADTRRALADKRAAMGDFRGIVNFHCILRTLELEAKGLTEAYGRLFSDIPTIGFSTYGEQYIGHINQTATMLVFGHGSS